MKKWVGIILSLIIALTINVKTASAVISVSPACPITIGANSSQQLQTTGNVNTVTMRSSNTDVVYIENYTVYAINPGTSYVTVTDGLSTYSCKVIVVDNYVPVSSITLSKTSETLTLKSKSQIIVNIYPSNATNKTVSYTSNNSSIASVDSNGLVTANKVGKTYITVSVGNKTQIYNVTVVDNVSLNSISIPSSLSLQEGKSSKLNVTYNPTTATNKVVTWRSSNNRVVTVDGSGNVKAISTGSATVTVTSNDGNHIATCNVTVTAASSNNNNNNNNNNTNNDNNNPNNENNNNTNNTNQTSTDATLKEITLSKTELSLMMGDEATLTVNFNPSNFENKKVKWTSTNDDIAFVDDTGKIKAIKPGKVTIKATTEEGNKTAKCTVTVKSEPIQAISFGDEEITVYVDSKTTLVTISEPENTAIDEPIWTSSDEEVATVKDGTITAKKIGSTVITVSDETGEITASIVVNVAAKPDEKLLITVEGYDLGFDEKKKEYTLTIGNESELDIKVNRDNGKYSIGGNRDLKNGSIITVTIKDNKKTTYVINIKKKQNYTLYLIGFISLLLFINIIRLLKKNKKKKK